MPRLRGERRNRRRDPYERNREAMKRMFESNMKTA
jgi:hypothetical protein